MLYKGEQMESSSLQIAFNLLDKTDLFWQNNTEFLTQQDNVAPNPQVP
jgi:hypothetical protein